MNKDLELIKDRIAQSEIKAPADMDESFVISRLEGVQPKVTDIDRARAERGEKGAGRIGSKHSRRRIAAIAAAVVLVCALGVAIGSRFIGKPHMISLPGGLSVIQFRNHNEIKRAVKEIKDAKYGMDALDYVEEAQNLLQGGFNSKSADSNAAVDSSSRTGSSSSGSSNEAGSAVSFSETYKQVEGVDEADIIKTDGKYIYCVDNGSSGGREIVIFTADGEDPRRVGVINVLTGSVSTADEAKKPGTYDTDDLDDIYIRDIYVRGDRLIVMCCAADSDRYYYDTTCVMVYDIGDIDNISLLDSMTQSGSYRSSRMIGDTLYTVSSYYIRDDDDYIPACGRGSTPEEVPADSVYCLAYPEDDSFLVISAYDTVDYSAQTESKAILGTVDDIYCSEENMYIYSTVYDYGSERWYDEVFGVERNGGSTGSTVKSQIMKVDLTDGISFTAYTEIDGRIDDQYALDEKDGNLRVSTTSRMNWTAINKLYVLDGQLSVIGSTEGFAKGEEIKAVRYVGDTAYVITFEQTDPLFVIDLTDPTSPEILGSAEITGFSTMLVPIDDNTLLGIGYHSEDSFISGDAYRPPETGFKLALFDVSDKLDPKVLDSISYVDYESKVMYEPKALVYNPDRGDFIVPLNYSNYYGVYDYENDVFIDSDEPRGGMLNFRVEDGRLVVTEHYESDYDWIDRCVYVGDTVYMTCFGDDDTLTLDTTQYK